MAEPSIESQTWRPQPKYLAEIERKFRAKAFLCFGSMTLIPICGKLSRIYSLSPAWAGISYVAVVLILVAVMYPLFAKSSEQEQKLFQSEFERFKPEAPNPLRAQVELKREGFLAGKDSGWLWIEGSYLCFRGLRGEVKVPASSMNRIVKEKDKGFYVFTPEFVMWVNYPLHSENFIPATKFYEEAALWQSLTSEPEEQMIFPKDVQKEYWFDSKKQRRTIGAGLLASCLALAYSALAFLDHRSKQPVSVWEFHFFAWPMVLVIAGVTVFFVMRQRRATHQFQTLGLQRAG